MFLQLMSDKKKSKKVDVKTFMFACKQTPIKLMFSYMITTPK